MWARLAGTVADCWTGAVPCTRSLFRARRWCQTSWPLTWGVTRALSRCLVHAVERIVPVGAPRGVMFRSGLAEHIEEGDGHVVSYVIECFFVALLSVCRPTFADRFHVTVSQAGQPTELRHQQEREAPILEIFGCERLDTIVVPIRQEVKLAAGHDENAIQ